MTPVPLGLDNALSNFLSDVAAQLQELGAPQYPHPVYACVVASLPLPASDWTHCVVDLTDLNTLGKSDGTNWRRVDTGAIVA